MGVFDVARDANGKLLIPSCRSSCSSAPAGAGKSTFARKHFKPTEVLSSDFCRGLVERRREQPGATGDAFDVLQVVAAKR
jgi:protein phosphatase